MRTHSSRQHLQSSSKLVATIRILLHVPTCHGQKLLCLLCPSKPKLCFRKQQVRRDDADTVIAKHLLRKPQKPQRAGDLRVPKLSGTGCSLANHRHAPPAQTRPRPRTWMPLSDKCQSGPFACSVGASCALRVLHVYRCCVHRVRAVQYPPPTPGERPHRAASASFSGAMMGPIFCIIPRKSTF